MNEVGRRFIDSSMLVRYFTDDLPDQADIAERVIESENLFVNSVILLECGYVLTKLYGYPRDHVVDALVSFLARENVAVSDLPTELAAEALLRCKGSSRVSFGDALIIASMHACGAAEIYSFDGRIAAAGVRVLKAPAGHRRG
ncbi:MAG: PIN domain-containing protein [Chloroflexi bacterium]|nr:PIN domain-containing protein [Chloroflexota bacterium]